MKKVLALLVVCFMLMTTLASCSILDQFFGKECTEHVDANGDYICDNCEAELEKPHEHDDADGDNVCDGCGEKLGEPDAEKVLVEDIIVSTDDDEGEGTIENPFKVNLAQGNSIDLSYAVQPKDATDKSFTWSVVDEGKGITFSDNGTKLTITAAADATSAIVEGKANDGSGVKVYLSVIIEVYNAVTGITSSTLLGSEAEEYDYVLVTALGTKWDMSGDILARGQQLLDGQIFGGSQKPRNITYWPSLQNFGILVAPDNATNPAIIVSYSNEGIVRVDVDGSWTALAAGETVVTIASFTEPDVTMKVKVVVKDSLYRGILMEDYEKAVVSSLTSWDLDADHNTDAQFARYDDWHLVMIHSNESRGSTGIDNNQKIFYMGQADRPYGICLENNVGANSGGSLTDAASLMWAKLTIPEGAMTFNIKIGNNDKVHGQYRVLWVKEDGTTVELTEGWIGFTSGPSESTQKLDLPAEIKGTTGAMVVEHRVTEYDNNAELQIKVMKFEGYNAVTGVELKKNEGTYKPGQSFKIEGAVKPDNATNDKLVYSVADPTSGITVDGNGNVTIPEGIAGGVYYINVASAENAELSAQYKLIVTNDEIAVNKWDGKSEILNGVQGVKWEIVGETDAGVGEGADLKVTGDNTWSALKLEYRSISASNYILTFGARVFHRDGETYPHFVVKVNGQVIRGAGQSEDYFYVDTDETQYCSYDLSDYIGKVVTIEIGITRGTHAVVQKIEFTGSEYTDWADKSDLKDENKDAWAHQGDWDAGVGEGYDIKGQGSFLYNEFVIGKEHNSQFTFGARVFHRDGETYPEILVIVQTADGTQHVIKAKGQANDYVYVDTDAIQHFTYDLSAFAGQKVTVAIALRNAATHCVITDISMKRATPLVDKVTEWNGKSEILNGVEDVKWEIVGETDAGVGEGADLKVTGDNTWSSLKLEGKTITAESFMLKFGARVFVRSGETYPHFVVKVDGEVVRGVGQSEDYFYVESDETLYCSYDLSKYLGQKVTIEIGITQGTHAVVQYIGFSGTDAGTKWANKAELLNAEGDAWAHVGDCDAGVGEGYDIRGEGSYIYNDFLIGKDLNSQFTFGGRVFHRSGETYPEVYLVVVDVAGVEHRITANGAENDYVYFDTDDIQHFTYDLSAFAGQTVQIRLILKNAATHCVFTDITMAGATAE